MAGVQYTVFCPGTCHLFYDDGQGTTYDYDMTANDWSTPVNTILSTYGLQPIIQPFPQNLLTTGQVGGVTTQVLPIQFIAEDTHFAAIKAILDAWTPSTVSEDPNAKIVLLTGALKYCLWTVPLTDLTSAFN